MIRYRSEKSKGPTHASTCSAVLGKDYGTDLQFSVLETKKYGSVLGEGVNLPGARFTKCVETREGQHLDEARVKSWTGGDTITIRPLHRNAFSFTPTHKLWLAFNDKPIITDDSPAMWLRVRLIPFLQTFKGTGADKGLLEKLKAEAPGILNWAIQGCLLWQQENELKSPKAVQEATLEYEVERDPLAAFFEDRCEIGNNTFRIPKGSLSQAYQTWCHDNGQRPISRNSLSEKMRSRFGDDRGTGGVKYWTGLRIRTLL